MRILKFTFTVSYKGWTYYRGDLITVLGIGDNQYRRCSYLYYLIAITMHLIKSMQVLDDSMYSCSRNKTQSYCYWGCEWPTGSTSSYTTHVFLATGFVSQCSSRTMRQELRESVISRSWTVTAAQICLLLYNLLVGTYHKTTKWSFWTPLCLYSLFCLFYFREKEREGASRGKGQRKREKIHTEHGAWCGAQSPGLWGHDLSRNQESDTQLTEPPRRPLLAFSKYNVMFK